jgi:predicted acyltransferase
MIIVNTPGSGATPFQPFLHADFLIGFLMYWFPFFVSNGEGELMLKPLSETRIMGVLQRIALCYLAASLLVRYFSTRTVIIISVIFLIGYWISLFFFGDTTDPYSMLGNAGSVLDMYLFGEKHLYHGEGVAFEPEGVLSTIPSIVNVIAGYYAGQFIRQKGKNYETVSKLFLTAALFICIALVWHSVFPINKKLWTSPFVLLTTGLDLAIIAALIYIIELRATGEQRWTRFFTIFGKNPLFIYLLSEVIAVTFYLTHINPDQSLFQWINAVFFQRVIPGAFGSLLFAIAFMLLCWSVGWWLDKRKIYIRV